MKQKLDIHTIRFLKRVYNIRDYIIFSNITAEEVDKEICIAISDYIKSIDKKTFTVNEVDIPDFMQRKLSNN